MVLRHSENPPYSPGIPMCCTRSELRAALGAGHRRRHPEIITRITKTMHNEDKRFIDSDAPLILHPV